MDIEGNKNDFLDICQKNIKRKGIDEVLDYLEEETDFFEAPASSRFHLACKGGLCEHSLNVFSRLLKEYRNEYGQPDDERLESLTIISLFHDICKANFYKEDTRNVKVDGVWTKVPYYSIDEKISLGHGEKSVILLLTHGLELTLEEIVAINSHMGFSDNRVRGGDWSVVNEWENYPVAMLLHIADLKASKIDEIED